MSPALRKAAVLIAALDEASAQALLAQMPPARAAHVQAAAQALTDVTAEEREEVLREFLGAAPDGDEPDDDFEGIELAGSLADPAQRGKAAHAQAAPPAAAPFAFLFDVPAEALARLLVRETPQTMAVVVAHLPPGQAAEVIARLMPRLQTEVLRRVADLGEMHPEILREIERHVEQIVRGELQSAQRKTVGLATVSAILSAAPGPERRSMLRNLTSFATDLAGQLGADSTRATGARSAAVHREVVHRETQAAEEAAPPALPARNPSPAPERAPGAAPRPRRLPLGVAFADVVALDNASLGAILRAADTTTALLALAGAPRAFVERILQQLAPEDATTLERQMERLGPLRLRDIEAAQQDLADLAGELAAAGRVRLPRSPQRMSFVA